MSTDQALDPAVPAVPTSEESAPVEPAAGVATPVGPPSSTPGLSVVALGEEHHDWAARLHVSELPHGLFPRLGPRFVAQWHRAQVASPHGVGYVALRDGEPVGFALACHDRSANVAWILAHRRTLLVRSGLLALARRPRVALYFLQTRAGRYLRRLVGRPAAVPAGRSTPTPSSPATSGPVGVLEAIVVVPGVRVTGVGRALVERFLIDTAESGTAHVELVTKDGDQGAAGFYRRQGWRQVSRHVDRDGDAVLRFRIAPGPLPR